MNAWPAWQMRDRYDRRVSRVRLRVDALAPPRRLAFTIEETLRLVSLPGESEGRCYYFRALRITGLPSGGDRQAWLTAFQLALEQQARQAVHGGDFRAAESAAVFFFSEQEALEILLHRALARRAAQEWFWPMVLADTRESEDKSIPDAGVIPRIIKRLRSQPASWVGVATALFATPLWDVAHLCRELPSSLVNAWLAGMEGAQRLYPSATPQISSVAILAVSRAMRLFGLSSAHTLWLATLGLLLESPANLADGSAVTRARIAVRQLAVAAKLPVERDLRLQAAATLSFPAGQPGRNELPLQSAGAEAATTSPGIATSTDVAEVAQSIVAAPQEQLSPHTPPLVAASGTFASPGDERAATLKPAAPDELPSPATLTRWCCQRSPTQAAGFFFLLNALQRIGFAQALANGLAGAPADLVHRLMLDLFARTGIPADPVSQWLHSLVNAVPPTLDHFQCDASCWPLNLPIERETVDSDFLRRVWCVAVRRWCWRAARISLREIVTRPGVFSVNRTDLDVSMLLDSADVRIRKAGLDLDPGWLPWFGFVVRFHYMLPGELYV